MFKSSSNLIRQASQRGASRLIVSAPSGRPLSTSTIRFEEHAEGQEESRQSRMASLLLEIPPEFKIQNLGPKEPRQSKKPQGDRSQKRPANASQSSQKPWTPPMQASDTYAALQGLSFPPRQRRTTDASRRQNDDGKDRKPREGNGQRPERKAQGGPRMGDSRDDRQPRQNDREGRGRAESSRSASKPRAPRGDGADSSSARTPPQPRQQKPEPVVRAAPTAQELFGESSMLGGQSNVGSEVFENLDLSDEEAIGKNVPKVGNLDLLPPSPVFPRSLIASTPRKQINQFAVLQADYVLSRNPNVSLDQRGQAIGMVKQRLGA